MIPALPPGLEPQGVAWECGECGWLSPVGQQQAGLDPEQALQAHAENYCSARPPTSPLE